MSARRNERSACRLVAGLGNPGSRYAATRHNIGFRVVEALAQSAGIAVRRRRDVVQGAGRIAGRRVLLARPVAYMNLSGPPVERLMQEQGIGREALLVVHDDLDLAFGRLKIKEKGGDGGHRGVRSLMDALGGGDFARLRIGIGRPAGDIETADYVLSDFEAHEVRALPAIVERAREAVVTVLARGIGTAMNSFNMREP